MKNPFKKEDNTGLIVGVSVGVAAGIALGYLFLTKKGAAYREQLANRVKDCLSDRAADFIERKTFVPKKAAKVATDAAIK